MVFCNNKKKLIKRIKLVTILILIDGFLQYWSCLWCQWTHRVTILILIDGFLQYGKTIGKNIICIVTILILIDGFLQSGSGALENANPICHNPYFNRWFSAIAAKISQNFTFLCKKLVFSDSFCELYFTQPLYINYCTNYLNTFLLKLAKIKAIINII